MQPASQPLFIRFSPPDTGGPTSSDPLGAWNDGPSKQTIVRFVEQVSAPDGPGFVPPPERIAAFDNDGTLWSEKPFYFQLAFALHRIRALAPEHPEWREQQPYKAALADDLETLLKDREHASLNLLKEVEAGTSTEEFDRIVREWLAEARHPRWDRPYTDLVFQPMLELLKFLRNHQFQT